MAKAGHGSKVKPTYVSLFVLLIGGVAVLLAERSLAPMEGGDDAGIRAALRTYVAKNCDLEDVVEHAGLYGTPDLQLLRHWLYATLLPSRRSKIIWRKDDSFWSSGELSYWVRRQRYDVWWDDYHPPGIPVRRHLELRACLFAPKHLDLIDEVFDDKGIRAEVRFMPLRGYSWIGRQLKAMGLLTGNNAFAPMNGYMSTSWLNRTQQGNWRVSGVS